MVVSLLLAQGIPGTDPFKLDSPVPGKAALTLERDRKVGILRPYVQEPENQKTKGVYRQGVEA